LYPFSEIYEAKDFLISRCELKIKGIKENLDYNKKILKTLQSITKECHKKEG